MKKIIAMSLSLILMAGVITGCGAEPGEKATLKQLESDYGGERFEIDGNTVHSLDRDLEFTYSYEWESGGPEIWPDVKLPLGGKYNLNTTYRSAVYNYWNDEYRNVIEKYGFADVDYGPDGDDEDECMPSLVYIFIEDGASDKELEKVESLLFDLRGICRDEDDFHDSDHIEGLVYCVHIWYIDSEAEEYRDAGDILIDSDTKDKDLRIDNFRAKGTYKNDPRTAPLDNGKAKVYVK